MTAYQHYSAQNKRDFQEYSANRIDCTASERWNYAIPENYTNFQDGFLFQTADIQRGSPMLTYNGETLYFFRSASFVWLPDGITEMLLVYDRHGNKYTFSVHNDETPP
jgi:hypothetical protein